MSQTGATRSQESLPRTLPLVRVMAMPADANPNGDIFGGWLMSQMDLAGGSLATQRALRHSGGRRHGVSPARLSRGRGQLLRQADKDRAHINDSPHRGVAPSSA